MFKMSTDEFYFRPRLNLELGTHSYFGSYKFEYAVSLKLVSSLIARNFYSTASRNIKSTKSRHF